MNDIDDTPEEDEVHLTAKQRMLPKRDAELPIDVGFRHMTKGMFYEYRFQSTSKLVPPFTLKHYDFTDIHGVEYKSVYMMYMEADSEYEAAINILGSYNHWLKLSKTAWFSAHLEEWESERNTRDEAIARSTLIRAAECGNVPAANAIFKNSKAGKKAAGRPSNGGSRKEDVGERTLEDMLRRTEESEE
jgi:hypothetical protein